MRRIALTDRMFRALALAPLVAVTVGLASGLLIYPGPAHLSIDLVEEAPGVFRVTRLMPGGIGWQSDLREGDNVTEPIGGAVLSVSDQPRTIRNPTTVRMPDESLLDAGEKVATSGNLAVIVAALAVVFAATGGLVALVRQWDPATRWLLLLFGCLGVVLAVGNYSGTRGGVVPILVVGLGTAGVGYGLVGLFTAFPYPSLIPDWRVRRLMPAFTVGLVFVCLAVLSRALPSEEAFRLAQLSLGLYLGAAVVAAAFELIVLYWRNPGQARRSQAMLLMGTFLVGLGPSVFLVVVPTLITSEDPPQGAWDVAVALMLLIPVGVAVAMVRYQTPWLNGLLQRFVLPGSVGVFGFLFGVLVFSYLVVALSEGESPPFSAAAIMGVITALVALSSVFVVSATRRTITAGELQEPKARLLRDIHEGPLSTALQMQVALDQGRGSREDLRSSAGRIVSQLRVMTQFGVAGEEPPESAQLQLVESLSRLAREAERMSPVVVELVGNGRQHEPRLSGATSQGIYAVVQEGLDNVLSHTTATEARVRLDIGFDEVRVSVSDTGAGFDADGWRGRPDYFGLRNARTRFADLGGWLDVESSEGRGTTLRGSVPVAAETAESSVYSDGILTIDSRNREVVVNGAAVALTPTEMTILRTLVRNAGNSVTRQEIARTVWGEGPGLELMYDNLKWHVSRLRQKLGSQGASRIVAVRGVGYRYEKPGDGRALGTSGGRNEAVPAIG